MGVSSNRGTPKSSILVGLSTINHPAIGVPSFMETPYVNIVKHKQGAAAETVWGGSLQHLGIKMRIGHESNETINYISII